MSLSKTDSKIPRMTFNWHCILKFKILLFENNMTIKIILIISWNSCNQHLKVYIICILSPSLRNNLIRYEL